MLNNKNWISKNLVVCQHLNDFVNKRPSTSTIQSVFFISLLDEVNSHLHFSSIIAWKLQTNKKQFKECKEYIGQFTYEPLT